MFAFSFNKMFTVICLLGGVLAHPLEGALEERDNGPVTSVVSAHVSTVTLGGGSPSVGCDTVTYLPGPTTTIVASPVTITSYASSSSYTVTSSLSTFIPTYTAYQSSAVASSLSTFIPSETACRSSAVASSLSTFISSYAVYPSSVATSSLSTFIPSETVYPSSAVASTSVSAQVTTVTAS